MNELIFPIIWIIVIVALLITEAATINLVTIWFAIGAVPALIVSLLDFGLPTQLIVFLITSVILLALTRNFVNKIQRGKTIKTNYEAIVGQEGFAKDTFVVGNTGYVKINGMDWLAFSNNDDISAHDKVIVRAVTGSKVRVDKV